MTDEITIRPAELQREAAPLEQQEEQPKQQMQAQQQMQANTNNGVLCPHCGTQNDMEAKFCASCGAPLHMANCPNCGSEIDPDADFCEACHHYIRTDVCSFCGAHYNETDPFCPECGSPRGGIVCPTCHTLNDFAFCKQCGQPLTVEAHQIMAELKQNPNYQELIRVAREYNELQMQLPCTTESEKMHYEKSQQLRERVLTLLAQDEGLEVPVTHQVYEQRLSEEELNDSKQKKLEQITKLLERMSIPPTPSPAKVRNYAMAQKPIGVRLAWMCNYKHALHSSPCGCAKPQMGGQWVVLGHNSNQEIKDDK